VADGVFRRASESPILQRADPAEHSPPNLMVGPAPMSYARKAIASFVEYLKQKIGRAAFWKHGRRMGHGLQCGPSRC
jgi:hypothetical protein